MRIMRLFSVGLIYGLMFVYIYVELNLIMSLLDLCTLAKL